MGISRLKSGTQALTGNPPTDFAIQPTARRVARPCVAPRCRGATDDEIAQALHREGAANWFLFVEPLRVWRSTSPNSGPNRTLPSRCGCWSMATSRRRSGSCWSSIISILILPAALYQTFAPDETRRITSKLEFHYTPSMAVDSIWPNANSRSWRLSAWIAGFPISAPCV